MQKTSSSGSDDLELNRKLLGNPKRSFEIYGQQSSPMMVKNDARGEGEASIAPRRSLARAQFLKPAEVLQEMWHMSISKRNMGVTRTFLSAILAGMYIAIGGLLAIIIGDGIDVPNQPGWHSLAFGGTFPLGLILVIIAGSSLFTGNILVMTVGVLTKKISVLNLAKNWVIVYVGNLVGALLVAYFLGYQSGIIEASPILLRGAQGHAVLKTGLTPGQIFVRAIGCNWLVCLAVWLAAASRLIVGKVLVIWWTIMAFVAIGFEHCIANMFFIPLGIFLDAPVTTGDFIYPNLVCATAGNIVGGGLFVGFFYWLIYGDNVPLLSTKKTKSVAQNNNYGGGFGEP